MTSPMDGARAMVTVDSVKIAMPVTNIFLRPVMSAILATGASITRTATTASARHNVRLRRALAWASGIAFRWANASTA